MQMDGGKSLRSEEVKDTATPALFMGIREEIMGIHQGEVVEASSLDEGVDCESGSRNEGEDGTRERSGRVRR